MSNFYLGNANLKGCGVPVSFTQEQLTEHIKCSEDPIYFIEKYCKIISLDRGIIDFKLHSYQKRMILAVHNNRFVLGKIGRQLGKTQCIAGYIVWYILYNDASTVAILANKASAAREVMSRVQFMYEALPFFLQQGVKTYNKGDIELENGSKIFTAATSANAARGRSVNFLYIDEAAIIANTVAEEFFTSTYPTISSGKNTKIVMTSTPLGLNHFWHRWKDAEAGLNDFICIEAHWSENPERDQAWADKQLRILGELKFNQEVLCHWLGSSNSLISAQAIEQMRPKRPVYSKDNLDLYEFPINSRTVDLCDKDHSYVIVVDTGKGVGGDYSAFSIIDITSVPYKVVGKYRDANIAPMLYPSIIYKTAKEFNEAFVLMEINSSEQVPHILYYEMEYENILMVTKGKGGQMISSGFGGTSMGVITDKKVKRIGCSNVKSLIEEGKLIIEDSHTIEEISTFVQVKDSYAADDGYHDDLIMTLVLFGWLTTQTYFRDMTDVDMRKILYQNRMEAIDAEVLPTGFMIDGTEEEQETVFNF